MSTQTKVGLVVLIAAVLLAMIITWKSAIFLKFSGYEMIGSFTNVEGLTIGSEIRYRGFKVGKVLKIDATPEDVKVYCVIDRDISFPADSTLRVAFDGLVGLKYLEVRPGKSTDIYRPSQILPGVSTAGIVDFVDVGTQNLAETKRIFVALRDIVENPELQRSFTKAIFNIEKITVEINKLTSQLQLATDSINKVVADKNFQEDVKGTIASTHKTLASANNFFEGVGRLRVKPSGDVLMGGSSSVQSGYNQFKGNLDIIQDERTSWKISMGEGPTRNITLLDFQIAGSMTDNLGLRIGMINTHLGGGVDLALNKNLMLSSDIYDINNPKPNNPKLRLTTNYKFTPYVDFLLQGDDLLNSESSNYSAGLRIKGGGD